MATIAQLHRVQVKTTKKVERLSHIVEQLLQDEVSPQAAARIEKQARSIEVGKGTRHSSGRAFRQFINSL